MYEDIIILEMIFDCYIICSPSFFSKAIGLFEVHVLIIHFFKSTYLYIIFIPSSIFHVYRSIIVNAPLVTMTSALFPPTHWSHAIWGDLSWPSIYTIWCQLSFIHDSFLWKHSAYPNRFIIFINLPLKDSFLHSFFSSELTLLHF